MATYNPRDYYFKKAKEENFVARSVFKLQEIDEKFRIIKSGSKILDLGCCPGSWSQYSSTKIGPSGMILGIDLTESKVQIPNGELIQGDIFTFNFEEWMQTKGIEKFDVVLSDMAPKTTGIRMTDQARSLELCEMALGTALKYLRPNGHFVCKLFHSSDFENFRKTLRTHFASVEISKPKSTRVQSKEIFLIGKSLKH